MWPSQLRGWSAAEGTVQYPDRLSSTFHVSRDRWLSCAKLSMGNAPSSPDATPEQTSPPAAPAPTPRVAPRRFSLARVLYDDKPEETRESMPGEDDTVANDIRGRARGPSFLQVIGIAAEESIKLLNPRRSDAVPVLLSLQAEPMADEVVRRSSIRRRSTVTAGRVMRSPVELDEMVTAHSRHCWSALAPTSIDVRGANYLRDRKKVPSESVSQVWTSLRGVE